MSLVEKVRAATAKRTPERESIVLGIVVGRELGVDGVEGLDSGRGFNSGKLLVRTKGADNEYRFVTKLVKLSGVNVTCYTQ